MLCSKSMMSIEDLSNELFYEIFEYLNSGEIYQAFSKLNIRFANLRIFSFQPLKIRLHPNSESLIENLIIPNRNRIISLHLSSMVILEVQKFTPLDSTFSGLESLVISGFNPNEALRFIDSLKLLPRLSSLTLQIDGSLHGLQTVYQSLHVLSVLKYCKISSKSTEHIRWVGTPVKVMHMNSIEHLVMDHDYDIDELLHVLSYTPRVGYLSCKSIRGSNLRKSNALINLSNLKYISFKNCYVDFPVLRTFFEGIRCQVQVLRLKTSAESYADAYSWEQFITHHMPCLLTFYLRCSVNFDHRFRLNEKSCGLTSSFWRERRWICELQVEMEKFMKLIYSIHPHRKKWYDSSESEVYSDRSIEHNSQPMVSTAERTRIHERSIELSVTGIRSEEGCQSFISNTIRLFKNMPIRYLNINHYEASIESLIKLLSIFDEINSLRIFSFRREHSKILSFGATRDCDILSKNNTITKLFLEQIDEPGVCFLVMTNVWPCVEYLEIIPTKDVRIEIILRIILKKHTISIPRLRCLCLHLTNINDQMTEQLQTTISIHKLLDHYTTKDSDNKLYLRWN